MHLLRKIVLLVIGYIFSVGEILKGPSQPHLCFCLHARIWLLSFYLEPVETNKNHCETTQDNYTYLQEHSLQ